MKEIHLRKWALSFLFIAVAALRYNGEALEPTEVYGKTVPVEYLGERTTEELNAAANTPAEIFQPSCFIPFKSPAASYQGHKPSHEIGLNFTAATLSNAGQTDVIPLNLTGWVGEKQYILMTYQCIRSFDKHTGKPDHVLDTDAGSFFGFDADDVRIDYDRFAKRWYAAAEYYNVNTGLVSDLYLAVSSDSVITKHTKWSFYRITNAQLIPQLSPLGSGNLDYCQLAVDKNAVYIVEDTFNGEFTIYEGSTLVIFEKKSLLAGKPHVTIIPGILPGTVNPSLYGAVTPAADNFDPDAKYGYLIHADNFEYPSTVNFNQLAFYRILNPGSKNPSLTGPIYLDVPTYSSPQNAPHAGNLYGVNGYLQSGIFGGAEAPHVRNGQLFVCYPSEVNSSGEGTFAGDRIGVMWFQFDLSGDSTGHGKGKERHDTVPALVQKGVLHDSNSTTDTPVSYYIPSIMTNKRMDLIIEGTTSSAVNYTNVMFAGRRKSDPPGTLRAPVFVTNNTSTPYNFGPLVNPDNANIGQRWGDESSLCPDPCNDLDIWLTGEWAAVENGYGVQTAQIKPLK